MSEKSDFIRKSVSFNVNDPIDKQILEHIDSQPFTKYVKALILADIVSDSPAESFSETVETTTFDETQATTNDLLNAINNIADILSCKVISQANSPSKESTEHNKPSENSNPGALNAEKFKAFENFQGQ